MATLQRELLDTIMPAARKQKTRSPGSEGTKRDTKKDSKTRWHPASYRDRTHILFFLVAWYLESTKAARARR